MTCTNKQYIQIFKGDDTNWNNERFLNVTVVSDLDLSSMRAKFILGSFNQIFPLTTPEFSVDLSRAVTGAFAYGPIDGVIQILDSENRIKTVTNTIPFYVTNKVIDEQDVNYQCNVSPNSPIEIKVNVGGGGGSGKAEWGFITGTLSDQEDLQAALDAKQNALTTQQQAAVNSGIDSTKVGQIATNASDISTINGKIPAQASTENQLADKNFVNSSIATNTANFIGTFNSVADLEAYSGNLTNNDYAFVVGTDADGNTVYNRYKYNGETQTWIFEYALNNSSFTAAQWAALNSGITDTAVTQIGTNTTNIGTLTTDKQPKTLETPISVEGTSQTTVENALGAINTLAAKGLQNKATGANSVAILSEAPFSGSNSVMIGAGTTNAQSYAVGVGYIAQAGNSYTVSIGAYSQSYGNGSIAIGSGPSSTYAPKASNTNSIAIGKKAQSTASDAIQLGSGSNSTANTLQVYTYPMLDGTTGKIPSERLPSNVLTKNDLKYWYSGFSSSAYLLLPCSGWFSGNWEFQTRIRLSSFPASGGRYFFSQNSTKSFELGYTYQGNIIYFMSTNGSSWVSNTGYATSLTLTANTDTLVNVSFDGAGYTVKISTDSGTTWQSDTNATSTQVYASGTNIILGNSQDRSWAASTMYLCSTDTYFKKAGTTVFSGSPFDYTVNGTLAERILWD